MLSIECRVGRLVESRLVSPIYNNELEEYDAQRIKVIQEVRASSPSFVNCTDLREVKILSGTHARYFIEMFKANNPSLDRAAFLISDLTFSLQVVRVIVEAHNPNRRYFKEIAPLCEWLDEVLTPEEQARLRAFYAERNPTEQTR